MQRSKIKKYLKLHYFPIFYVSFSFFYFIPSFHCCCDVKFLIPNDSTDDFSCHGFGTSTGIISLLLMTLDDFLGPRSSWTAKKIFKKSFRRNNNNHTLMLHFFKDSFWNRNSSMYVFHFVRWTLLLCKLFQLLCTPTATQILSFLLTFLLYIKQVLVFNFHLSNYKFCGIFNFFFHKHQPCTKSNKFLFFYCKYF